MFFSVILSFVIGCMPQEISIQDSGYSVSFVVPLAENINTSSGHEYNGKYLYARLVDGNTLNPTDNPDPDSAGAFQLTPLYETVMILGDAAASSTNIAILTRIKFYGVKEGIYDLHLFIDYDDNAAEQGPYPYPEGDWCSNTDSDFPKFGPNDPDDCTRPRYSYNDIYVSEQTKTLLNNIFLSNKVSNYSSGDDSDKWGEWY